MDRAVGGFGDATPRAAAAGPASLAPSGSPRPVLVPRLSARGPRSISKPRQAPPKGSASCSPSAARSSGARCPSDTQEERVCSESVGGVMAACPSDTQEAHGEIVSRFMHFEGMPPEELEALVAADGDPPPHRPPADLRCAEALGRQLRAVEARLGDLHRAVDARLEECAGQWRSCAGLLGALERRMASQDILGGVDAAEFQEAVQRLLHAKESQQATGSEMATMKSSLTSSRTLRLVRSRSRASRASTEGSDQGVDPTSLAFADEEHSSGTPSEPSGQSAAPELSTYGRASVRVRDSTVQSVVGIFGDATGSPRLTEFINSVWFNAVVVVVTLVNAAVVAVDTELATTGAIREATGAVPGELATSLQDVFQGLQRAFVGWLLLEVVLRVVALRASFFCGPERYWNLFDSAILMVCLVGLVSNGTSPGYLRIVRLARIVRSMQAFRVFRGCESLHRISGRCMAVAGALFWTGCFLFVLIYIVGIMMMDGVTSFLHRDKAELAQLLSAVVPGTSGLSVLQALNTFYGGLGRTWVTLFLAMTGGNLHDVIAPLGVVSPVWQLVWVAYLFCAVFGLLNILTATVVNVIRRPLPQDRAFDLDAEDAEERLLAKFFASELRRLGKPDGTEMTKHIFEQVVHSPAVARRLRQLGLDVSRAEDLYHLVDPEDMGGISPEVAARRFLCLRGEAKSLDVMRIAREVNKVRHDLTRVAGKTWETAAMVKDIVEEVAEEEELFAPKIQEI